MSIVNYKKKKLANHINTKFTRYFTNYKFEDDGSLVGNRHRDRISPMLQGALSDWKKRALPK